MIIVTGAAGFIGSCIVSKLNECSQNDLILVDHLNDAKQKNLEGKKYTKYFEKDVFLKKIEAGDFSSGIDAIIHMGACSSTTLQDEDYFERNNYQYTKALAQWSLANNVRFIYASSAATYGDGSIGYDDDDQTIKKCKPLNLYGESKQKFDLWALNEGVLDKIVGLKFFNVFGPNEYHKGDMRSVVCKAYRKVVDEGKIGLFKSYHDQYADGEQLRDFIYVKDVVNMTLFFLKNPRINGIFNIGTGKARSWNDVANALFLATQQGVNIEYVEMPEILKDKYQYFTQANISKIRSAGYEDEVTSLEDSIKDYVSYLKNGECL